MRICAAIIGVLMLSLAVNTYGEPTNVLVGDLTFTRPETWNWAPPPDPSPATSRLVITEKPMMDVRFYAPGKTIEQAKTVWKTYLESTDPNNFQVEKKTIGQRTFAYITLQGNIKLPGERPTSNMTFLGVVIPYENKSMHIRLWGPSLQVTKVTLTFKKMIEDAIRDRETELHGN